MAKLHGILKLSGSLDELSYYKTKFGYVVRRKGGFNAKRLKKDKVYERSRETAREFGACPRAGKLIRNAFKRCIPLKGDQLLVSRLNSVLLEIKNLDVFSARGKRHVNEGLGTDAGKKLLKGFNFNVEAPLGSILKKEIRLDTGAHRLSLKGLIAKTDLVFPKGATHFSISGGVARIDFEALTCEVSVMPAVTGVLDNTAQDTLLSAVDGLKGKTGFDVYFAGVAFFQKVAGELQALKNERYMAGWIVEVISK